MIDTASIKPIKKDWGLSAEVFLNPNFEIRHGYMNPGGYTSCHTHMRKHNMVYVITGIVLIHLYSSEDVDCRKIAHTVTLQAGERIIIPPKVWHRLYGSEACSSCDFIEVYWNAPVDPEDSIARDVSGSDSF